MSNLRRLIRRELASLYDNGAFAATHDVITTRSQLIDLGEAQIVKAIRDELTTKDVLAAGAKGMPRPTNVERVVANVLGEALGCDVP